MLIPSLVLRFLQAITFMAMSTDGRKSEVQQSYGTEFVLVTIGRT